MKHTITDSWKSLLRFLTWYGLAVAAILYLLPWAGQWAEQHYEAMGSTARLISVSGFFIVVGAWQIFQMRRRSRQLSPNRGDRQPDFF